MFNLWCERGIRHTAQIFFMFSLLAIPLSSSTGACSPSPSPPFQDGAYKVREDVTSR